jgi:hypothetical protein
MPMQAGFDGAFGPVHVAFEGGQRGVLGAPLEQGGNDQHGDGENADGNVRRQPESGLVRYVRRWTVKH